MLGLDTLRLVFQSIVGYYWYLRLRGYEIDTVDFKRRSFGHQYALSKKTEDISELKRLIMKLAEKTGRRLRRGHYSASGIRLFLGMEDHSYYAKSAKCAELYSTQDIYTAAVKLLDRAPVTAKVTNLAISVYSLNVAKDDQLNLFSGTKYDGLSRSSGQRYG